MPTEVSCTITGTTPLLMNKFTDAAALAATNGTRSSISNADRMTPREDAGTRIHKSADGNPVIPQPMLLSCIMDAGRFFKIGKRQVTTATTSLFPGFVEFNDLEYPLQFTGPWEVDERPIRNPATKGRILRYRPKFEGWSLTFTMVVDDEFSLKVLREMVDSAGKKIGLGDYRPSCKGPFGKFVVTNWAEKNLDAA